MAMEPLSPFAIPTYGDYALMHRLADVLRMAGNTVSGLNSYPYMTVWVTKRVDLLTGDVFYLQVLHGQLRASNIPTNPNLTPDNAHRRKMRAAAAQAEAAFALMIEGDHDAAR